MVGNILTNLLLMGRLLCPIERSCAAVMCV